MRINFGFSIVKLLLLSSLVISLTSCAEDADTGLIKKVIANIVKNIPNLKEELKNSQSISVVVNKIVSTGFTSFQQQADMELYRGVSDENLTNFLTFVKSLLQLPDAYEKYFVENLSMILYSDFNEIVIYRVLFSVNTGGDCKYIVVMGQRTEDGMSDWLIGDVKSQFTLAPDVFVTEKSVSLAYGLFKSVVTNVVSSPKSITDDQLTTLFKFFEICVFERFAELLKIKVDDASFLQLEFLK
jgi:hypothetical protein